MMCENLAICKEDVKPHLRRMHLVVTSIKEFILAVDTYSKIQTEDKSYITQLQCKNSVTEQGLNPTNPSPACPLTSKLTIFLQ